MTADANDVALSTVIDRNLSRYQIAIFAMCAMVVFLDGIDTQVVGIAAPLIGRELGIATPAFGWIFSAGTLGATLGAFGCGVLADRIGRKIVLVLATAVFGALTLATSQVHSFEGLFLCRFGTGLGLGGAVPCFIALTSEYAPARLRATIVSLLWAAFPLGAALGALINSHIVHILGWRPLFVVWGLAPLAVAALHLLFLPESVRFMLARGGRNGRIAAVLRKIEPSRSFAGARFHDDQSRIAHASIRAVFGADLRVASVALSLTAFIVFGLLSAVASWTPSLVAAYGHAPAAGALVVAFNGFGSFFGTTAAGFLLERAGVTRTTIPALVGTIGAFVAFGLAAGTFDALAAASFVAGVCLGIASSSTLALAATTYTTEIRSTGIGWAMGMGRFGSVVAPILVGQLVRLEWSLLGVMLGLSLLAAVALPCVLMLGVTRRPRQKQPQHAAPMTNGRNGT